MSEDLGRPLATPRVGIAGNTQSLPQLERQVSTKAESSPVNFQGALTELAFTPTALGELGSTLMQSSSQAQAQKMGQFLGQNPEGNLLPPITDFDKTVSEAYKSQANTTIGLQANSLMLKGSEELNKQNKLTPGAIEAFTKNMGEGLQDLISMAPDSLRPQLESQYGNHLLNTTHEFNMRMNSQQKSEMAAKDSAWRSQQSIDIQNTIKDGNEKLAQGMQEKLDQNIKSSLATGAISASQAQTSLTTSKLNFQSSKSIKTWMDAKANGTDAEYLKSIANNKINGLSWSESETVRNNTLKYASNVEAAENRNESLFLAEAQQEITLGTFNEDRANFFKNNLRPLQYTHLMTQYAVANHKNEAGKLEEQNMFANADKASAFEGATKKQINNTYAQMVQAGLQKAQVNGNPITQEDAEYQAAANMATVVPDVIDGINRKLKNGNAQDALQGLQMFERLHALEGNKTIGVDSKALAMAEVFQDLLPSNPGNPEGALQQARDTIFNKDENVMKMNNLNISRYYQQHAADQAHGLSNAVNVSGLGGNGSNIDNQSAFVADVNSRFNGYMQLTDSNVEQSKKLVARDVAKVWGESEVNGRREITRLPIEGQIKIPHGAKSLIQSDIVEQLTPQLEMSKVAHSEGKLPYYWRLKEGRVSYDDYTKAKAEIDAKMNLKSYFTTIQQPDETQELSGGESSLESLYASLAPQRKIVAEFESGKPIEIEQVFDNSNLVKPKIFHINVQSSNWATISPKTGNVEGGVNMMVIEPETGVRSTLTGYYGSTKTQAQYSPNSDKINGRFISVNGLTPKSIGQLEYEYQIKQKSLENILQADYAAGLI